MNYFISLFTFLLVVLPGCKRDVEQQIKAEKALSENAERMQRSQKEPIDFYEEETQQPISRKTKDKFLSIKD